VPWLLFAVISRRDTPEAAVVVGLVGAVAVALPGLLNGQPKILELGTISFFIVFGLIVFVVDPGSNDFLARYGRAIATAGLSLIAFGSLAAGQPFTAQYAREQVDRSVWDTEIFRTLNRRFTALWGAVFLAMACSHVVAGAIDTRRAETIFNWVIPIALVVLAVRYMQRQRDGARAGRTQN
jgi:hypothetical protein